MTEPSQTPPDSIVDTLRTAREAAEAELAHCEARAVTLRKELGLPPANPKLTNGSSVNGLVENYTQPAAPIRADHVALEDRPVQRRKPRRAKALPVKAAPRKAVKAKASAKSKASGRLPRRTPEQVASDIGRIVSLVKKSKDGMRAEHIKEKLGFQVKEMPRLLKEGVKKRLLRRKGQKRATTYTAA